MCRLTAHSYKNRLEIPQAVGQTPTQKKKKSPAFQFFRLKCDLFGPNSLKQSAVTRHTVPKNMVTSRATPAHKARNVCFGHPSHPAGGSAVGDWVPGRRGFRPVSAT